MTYSDYTVLSTTERKILRKIFGLICNMVTKEYETRHDVNLQNMYGRPNVQ